ncbi:YolD-like family protein [Halanaerobium hydrogeniformans]|uniref:YolD-like protein n=1 Tax=Halanaerobium hydrogeniformans TaxID=656519 RepID=E4RL84_HALHG|nr:YolD-like family protein [Halanaerobium hydrogeniformans]ADQ15765.1 YolD-like protein [Halanaerobium hydrogeniformans]
MNFKDRGNKKWTSLMLVEHRKRLKELKENEEKAEKPELDEQEKADINYKLLRALKEKIQLEIIYCEDKILKKTRGYLEAINSKEKYILLSKNKKSKKTEKILMKNLIELKIL